MKIRISTFVSLLVLVFTWPALGHAIEPTLVIQAVDQGQYGLASQHVDELQKNSNGIRNFPEISKALLERAASASNGEFLVNLALALSPQSPRIALLASDVTLRNGLPGGLARIWHTLMLLPHSPSLFVELVGEIFLLVLLGLSASIFLLAAVQLAVNGAKLIDGVGDYLPAHIRGLLAPVILGAVLAASLPYGLLPALLLWSLVLSFFLPRCRWCAALAGAVALSWSLVLPIQGAVQPRIHSNFQIQLEELSAGGKLDKVSFPRGELVFEIGYAIQAIQNGEFSRVDEILAPYSSRANISESARRYLYLLLGIAKFHQKEHALAEEFFKRSAELGSNSPELFYYLAQSALARADLPGHELASEQFRVANPELAAAVLALESKDTVVLVPAIPIRELARPLLKPMPVDRQLESAIGRISRVLFPVQTESGRIAFGIVALVFGILMSMFRSRRVILPGAVSKIWRLVPGGALLVSDSPVNGAIFITFALVVLCGALESPIESMVLHSILGGFRGPAVLVAMLVLITPALVKRRSR